MWGRGPAQRKNNIKKKDLATPHVGKRQIDSPNAKMGSQNEVPEWGMGGWGQFLRFSNYSTIKQYFKMLISHEDVYSLPSSYCSIKVCSSSFYVL